MISTKQKNQLEDFILQQCKIIQNLMDYNSKLTGGNYFWKGLWEPSSTVPKMNPTEINTKINEIKEKPNANPNKRVVKVNPRPRDYFDVVADLSKFQNKYYMENNKDPEYATVTPSDYKLIEDHLETYGFDKRSSQLPEILGMKIEIKL